MGFFGVGVLQDGVDCAADFLANGRIGVGWDDIAAADLHELMRSLQPGDFVFIKSFPVSGVSYEVRAIGVVRDSTLLMHQGSFIQIGRNVRWLSTTPFFIDPIPPGKNNVRRNTIFQEFDPTVIARLLTALPLALAQA